MGISCLPKAKGLSILLEPPGPHLEGLQTLRMFWDTLYLADRPALIQSTNTYYVPTEC